MNLRSKKAFLFSFFLIFSGCGEDVYPWPEWIFEHWVWEDESTQDSAIALVEDYISRDIPVGVIIIDSPWETGYNTFEFDNSLYPSPREMIEYFHSRGVRVVLWITSTINEDAGEIFEYAKKSGFFLQRSAEDNSCSFKWWKGRGCLIDYFNPSALEWWHSLMDKVLSLNIDGWKCDGTDIYLIFGGVSYSPYLKRRITKEEYSSAYYSDFFYYTRKKLGKDRIIFARPADNYGTGVGIDLIRFAPWEVNLAGWVGDQEATFEGMKNALNNMLWSSRYHYFAFGSDIGGYLEDENFPQGRSKTLFIRWAQLGTFSPIMENGGGGEHRPWMFDEETLQIYRKFVKLRYSLLPYILEEARKAYAEGRSLMRFPFRNERVFLLGSDLLVFPIMSENNEIEVYFPEGCNWVYIFDRSRVYTGGSRNKLSFPLSEYPVFYKEGSKIEKLLVSF